MSADTATDREPRRTWPWALAVVALAALHLALTAAWMTRDGAFDRPPQRDAAWRRLDVVDIHERVVDDGFRGWLRGGYYHDDPHPPLMPMVAAALVHLVGGEAETPDLWWSQALFLVLLAVGTFRLARHFGPGAFAFSATALALSCPSIVDSMRSPLWPQMPMAAGVVWALDALVRSRTFTRTGWSVAFGVFLGCATLTKMLAPLYLVGSGAAALALGLARRSDRTRVARNATLAVSVAALVLATWYVNHWDATAEYATSVVSGEGQESYSRGVPLLSFERWLYYPRAMFTAGFGLVISALVVPAVLLLGARARARRPRDAAERTRREAAAVVAAGVVVGFAILALGTVHGDAYYLISFAPVGAIAAVAPVRLARSRALRTAGALVVASVVVGAAALAYRPHPGPLRDVHWPNRELATAMIEHNRARSLEDVRVGHVEGWKDHPFVNLANLRYEARREGVDVLRVPLRWPGRGETGAALCGVDFLVVDTWRLNADGHFEDLGALLEELRRLGFEGTVVAGDQVIDESGPHVVALDVADASEPFVPRAVLEDDGVRRHRTEFDNGWSLVGTRLAHRSGAVTLTTYWDAADDATGGYRAFVNLGRDYRSVGLPDPAGRTPERPLMARTTLNFALDPRSMFPDRDGSDYAPRHLLIGTMLPAEPDFLYARVLRTDLEVLGPNTVVLRF